MKSINLTEAHKRCIILYTGLCRLLDTSHSKCANQLALDCVYLIFWARVIGLESNNLDPQMRPFEPYILAELQRITSCFQEAFQVLSLDSQPEDNALFSPTVSLVQGADNADSYGENLAHSKNESLINKILNDSVGDDDYHPIHSALQPVNSDSNYQKRSRESFPDRLKHVSNTSEEVRLGLPRLLSEAQKKILDYSMDIWTAKIVSEGSLATLNTLKDASTTHDATLFAVVQHRLKCNEINESERDKESNLLQRMVSKENFLEWSIPQENHPEVIELLSESHSIGTFNRSIIFIEKRRNIEWEAEGIKALTILLRIDSLAARLAVQPKPAMFCSLTCLGYFSDPQDKMYGFVYAWPSRLPENVEVANVAKPRTLHEFLAANRDDPLRMGPSLNTRFDLAKKIAACVRMFHMFGWLHKSINCHNIVFFPSDTQDDDAILRSAESMFVCGFECSRQDGVNHMTEPITKVGSHDMYRHPDVTSFGRRGSPLPEHGVFDKTHDIYALGLLLVEIGLWDSLDIIHADFLAAATRNAESRVPTPSELREWAIRSGKDTLERMLQFSVGDKYSAAAMACLRGEIDSGAEYFSQLYTRVIEPLNFCFA